MSDTLGITTNPYLMNGLGSFGLGGYSSYGNYGDPSMTGMMMGTGTMGITSPYSSMGMGMGMMSPYNMGMMGMMDPNYMAQFYKTQAQTQQDIEKLQLQHTGAMNQLLLQSQTQAATNKDAATFENAMIDADIQNGITTLIDKVDQGDTDGICREFDKVKNTIYTKYASYFNKNAQNIDPKKSAGEWVEMLYANKVSALRGTAATLRSDIEAKCDGSFAQGFWSNFKGKDYHKRDAAETVAYIGGTNVDNHEGKEQIKKVGRVTEALTETVAAPIAGYLAAGAGSMLLAGTAKGMLSVFGKGAHQWIKIGTVGKWAGIIGAGVALAGDLIWQSTRTRNNDKEENKADEILNPKASKLAAPVLGAVTGGAVGLGIGKLAKAATGGKANVGKIASASIPIGAALGLLGDVFWQATN